MSAQKHYSGGLVTSTVQGKGTLGPITTISNASSGSFITSNGTTIPLNNNSITTSSAQPSIIIQHDGIDIDVGKVLQELQLYKTVFSDILTEMGVDVPTKVEKHRFIQKLSK